MWWLIAWVYDYMVSRMEPKQRKEFDEDLDRIRYADEYRKRDREERRALARGA